MKKAVNPKNQYKKGEVLLNKIGWPCIVMEGTRGNDPEIINMVEVFGFEHECGSIYTNEIAARISVAEFLERKSQMGFAKEPLYYKGELISNHGN